MATTNRMPNDFKQRLKEIQKHAPSAIIAGGAVRDTLNGKMVKDVDIFVSTDDLTALSCGGCLSKFQYVGGRAAGQGCSGYVTNQWLEAVYTDQKASSMFGLLYQPTQIIVVKGDPVDYVKLGFDFGICKTFYNGKSIFCLPEYNRDITNNTITMTLSEQQLTRMYGRRIATQESSREYAEVLKLSVAHAHRIKRKYPNFNIVMPNVDVVV